VASELFGAVLGFGWSNADRLTVRLVLPSPPDHTNGEWDEPSRRVIWKSDLESETPAKNLPVFCYASWTVADAKFQQAHFGRLVVRGDKLLEYCLWHAGLTDVHAKEWDQLISELRPGVELTNRLEAFQFTGKSGADSNSVKSGKELIKASLEGVP
jgi:hypothetical protein